MVFQNWHLLVLAVFVALVAWGLRVAGSRMLLACAAALVAVSGWLLYTLVLEETGIEHDANSRVDMLAFVGIPAVLGVGLGALWVKRARSRRA